MKPLSRDTDPKVEAVQIELLRHASIAQRFARLRSLTTTTVSLAKRAIRRSMPGAPEPELSLAFVALHYGDEVAAKLRQFLAHRDQ